MDQEGTSEFMRNIQEFNRYKHIFNQIFHLKSKSLNCLCNISSIKCKKPINNIKNYNKCVFDNNGDYLEDEDDDNHDEKKEINFDYVKNSSINSNNDEYNGENKLDNEIYDDNDEEATMNRCDMSCFKKMEHLYEILSSCFNNNNITLDNIDNLNDVNYERLIDVNEYKMFLEHWSKTVLYEHPYAIDNYGSTIYHYATNKNNLKLLICLLNINKNAIKICDRKGMSILERACQRNNLNIIKYLLTKTNINPNGSTECVHTPLVIAISNGYHLQVKLLLELKANPSIQIFSPLSTTPQSSSLSNNESILCSQTSRSTLDYGSFVTNNTSLFLMSPLRTAIVHEKFDCMKLLLKYGANVNEILINLNNNSINNDAYLCLKYANLNEYIMCLKLLFRHINEKNFIYMYELNNYIENTNLYRLLFISFIKSINQQSSSNNNNHIINNQDAYLNDLFNELLLDIDQFLANNSSIYTFTQTLFIDYIIKLIKIFYLKPKSLKELCRFKLRNYIYLNKQRNYNIFNQIDFLPNALKLYLLHEES